MAMLLVLSMRAAVGWCHFYHGGDVACHGHIVGVAEPLEHVTVSVLGLHVGGDREGDGGGGRRCY